MRICTIVSLVVLATAAANARTPEITAARTSTSPTIDGALDEKAWATAPKAENFWQRSPREGTPPEHQTEFHVLYDDVALYVGVRAFDSDPEKIRGMLTRRDEESASDWIQVGIDSYHDKRTAFVFAINPANVQRDMLMFNDTEVDTRWDAVWTASAQVIARGWSAEFRIPWNQLRFSPDDEHNWGLQVWRTVSRTNEETVWSPWPKSSSQNVSLFGEIGGIQGIRPPRRFELLPFAVTGVGVGEIEDDDPFAQRADLQGNLGFDFKYGLGNNITIAGTVNPDFGQVEADPSEVNLSANETFFAEKRPFFLDGTDIFKFGLGDGDDDREQLFYSRRIGATPHGTGDDYGDYYTEPSATTIYAATKLSGKTASGWSFGVLDAVTAQEVTTVADTDGARSTHVIEPLTNYAVLRLKKDFNDGRTHVGAALTSVSRALGDTDLASSLHDQAITGGLQFSHRFGDDHYSVQGRLIGSYVHGTAEAIDDTQRASQRYFQRPDADHLDYDPTRTDLVGSGLIWSLTKIAGDWRYGTGGDYRSPGLDINDLGFQSFADGAVQWVWSQYRDDKPGDLFHQWNVNVNAWAVSNWAPSLSGMGGNINTNVTFRNYWGAYAGIAGHERRWDNGGLRGGPALRADNSWDSWMGFFTDSRRVVRGGLFGNIAHTPATGSVQYTFAPEIAIQARSNFDIRLGTWISQRVIDDQFVTDVEREPESSLPDEVAYITARLFQSTLGMTLRVNYTFTPRLSLQLYAQPFISTGAYGQYKSVENSRAQRYADRFHVLSDGEIAPRDGNDPEAPYRIDRDRDDSIDYTFDPADFNFRQLRSNVVLRWEYRPGSTLFLVWSHERSSSESHGRFVLGDEVTGLFDEPGEHVFLAKLTYWWGL